MPFYESLFIVRSSLTDEETVGIMDKMKSALEKLGATILKAENWGKKRLGYELQHDRRGAYVQFQFEAAGKVVGQLERLYKLEDPILKFLTVRIEEERQHVPSGQTESDSDGIQ